MSCDFTKRKHELNSSSKRRKNQQGIHTNQKIRKIVYLQERSRPSFQGQNILRLAEPTIF
jgi:hypothetical protein